MQISDRAKDRLKSLEGLRLNTYKDTAGVLTIGYGHTGPDVKADSVWTREFADAVFNTEVARFAAAVDKMVSGVKLNQNQFDALVIFAYNIGLAGFGGSGTLASIRAGDFVSATRWWAKWNHIRVNGQLVVDHGLDTRRRSEIELFQTPTSVGT
jgi:lysozyme